MGEISSDHRPGNLVGSTGCCLTYSGLASVGKGLLVTCILVLAGTYNDSLLCQICTVPGIVDKKSLGRSNAKHRAPTKASARNYGSDDSPKD